MEIDDGGIDIIYCYLIFGKEKNETTITRIVVPVFLIHELPLPVIYQISSQSYSYLLGENKYQKQFVGLYDKIFSKELDCKKLQLGLIFFNILEQIFIIGDISKKERYILLWDEIMPSNGVNNCERRKIELKRSKRRK